MKHGLILILVSLFLSCCQQGSKQGRQEYKLEYFKAKYSITYGDLEKFGFAQGIDDNFTLGRRINSYIIVKYYIDHLTKSITMEEIEVKRALYNIDSVESFVNRNHGILLTPLCAIQPDVEGAMPYYKFFVRGVDRRLYECRVTSSKLNIKHSYPAAYLESWRDEGLQPIPPSD